MSAFSLAVMIFCLSVFGITVKDLHSINETLLPILDIRAVVSHTSKVCKTRILTVNSSPSFPLATLMFQAFTFFKLYVHCPVSTVFMAMKRSASPSARRVTQLFSTRSLLRRLTNQCLSLGFDKNSCLFVFSQFHVSSEVYCSRANTPSSTAMSTILGTWFPLDTHQTILYDSHID